MARVASVSSAWPPLPYETWSATCDTLHSHTQVLGKLAVALAPPEPQLQHAALRLSGRGWETLPLPAPDGSGALVVALDLHTHHAVAEHTDGRAQRIPLAPDRPVADVTLELLAAVGDLVGPVHIDPRPQETPWTTPLDEDFEHATYDPTQVTAYFAAATRAALVLAALRAPYRGRSTPVNAWWGTFDLAVSLFSGRAVDPPSSDFIMRNSANAQQIEVGWWPGDARYPHAAFFAFAFPAPDGFEQSDAVTAGGALGCETGRVRPRLGRRPHRARPARRRARLRPLGDSARLHRLQLGPGPRGQRRGRAPRPSSDPHGWFGGNSRPVRPSETAQLSDAGHWPRRELGVRVAYANDPQARMAMLTGDYMCGNERRRV